MSVFTNPASAAGAQAQAYIEAILGLLGKEDPITVLGRTPSALERTLDGLTPAQAAAPEAPGKWQVGAWLPHLADSDIVWGYRARMVLAEDRPTLTGYDQDLWADRLRYRDGDPREAVVRFGVLRRENLRLVRQASPSDLR